MPKEQFDFSKPEDQEQFNALPEDAKETLVEKAHEDAEGVEMSHMHEKIKNSIESKGIKKGDLIQVIYSNSTIEPFSFESLGSEKLYVEREIFHPERQDNLVYFKSDAISLVDISDIEFDYDANEKRRQDRIERSRDKTVILAEERARDINEPRSIFESKIKAMDILHNAAHIENDSK